MREKFKIIYFFCFFFLTFSANFPGLYLRSQTKEPLKTQVSNQIVNKEIKINDSKGDFDFLQKDYYLLGPGDLVEISLLDAPEFSGEYSVINDGTIPLPLIGSIYVNNLSIDAAKTLIQDNYRVHLLRPELNLTIKKPRPIKVSLIGEIVRPGIYSLTKSETSILQNGPQISNSGLPTVVDAVQKAGGITQNTNLKDVTLIRRLPGFEKESKVTKIDLIDLLFEGNHDQNLYLFDGDIIKFSKAPKLPGYTQKIAQANLSPSTINVRIVGQVASPGSIKLKANTPLVQAVLSAGGPIAWKANKGGVNLVRVNSNGTITKKTYKIDLNAPVSYVSNPPLKENDIVYVKSSILNNVSTGLGAITSPIAPIVTAFSLFELLN